MTPEKLNLFDRFFNRYKKEIIERKCEIWCQKYEGSYFPLAGKNIEGSDYKREVVIYKIIDRLTGSETIEKKYLN